MSSIPIKNNENLIGSLSNTAVYAILLGVSFFIRFPFFFRDYIDRDESTFILIGQSWVDGFLPYTQLWDIKPPLTFLFFAGIISIFGKSFIAIRLAGAFLVATTAFYTYKMGLLVSKKKIAFWSAIACVALQSMFGSIQGVMSEHICMAFLTPAVYFTLRYKDWYWLILAGLLMGISLMVKLNMAYTVLFLGLYLIIHFIRNKNYGKGFLSVAAYGLAILTVIALTILPYYQEGLQDLWWKSVIIAPLDYAGARRYSILKLLPFFFLIAAFFFFAWKRKYLDFRNSSIQLLCVAILGVLYSFFQGGRINSHYLIQLYPFLIIPVGIVLGSLLSQVRFKPKKAYLLLLFVLPLETYNEYIAVIRHKFEKGSFYNGEGITVPKYLTDNKISSENILFLEYHIGYWVLGQNPPTKAATHPSNICKPEMFTAYDNPRDTGLDEIRYLMEEIQPKTVVIRKNRSIFDPKLIEENSYINARLKNYYKAPITVDMAEIYIKSK